jgi:threonine dehydratase
MTVRLEDIQRAQSAIEGAVVETPFIHSRTLSDITGAELYLKLEVFQFTGSFKERGALVRLQALTKAERGAGVIAMSAGNHAQAVAHHARRLGIDATIVMPQNTPYLKISNTEKLGARVVLHGDTLTESSAFAARLAETEGRVFVHPYDDDRIIAGQGTVALEMFAERPEMDAIIVPVGGGGLIAGCAIAARALSPKTDIIGVQAALCPAMAAALRGEAPPAAGQTIAEGIAVKNPGQLTRAIVARHVTDILLASEGAIERAITLIAEIEKVVTEGAGAAPLAAVLGEPDRFAGKRVGLIISGGNIDSRMLASVLIRGLVRSGLLVRLRVKVSDQPGSLAKVTDQVAQLGGNIVEVDHERWFYDVPVRLTELDLLIEVRSPDDAERILAGLAEQGFPTRRLSDSGLDGAS